MVTGRVACGTQGGVYPELKNIVIFDKFALVVKGYSGLNPNWNQVLLRRQISEFGSRVLCCPHLRMTRFSAGASRQ